MGRCALIVLMLAGTALAQNPSRGHAAADRVSPPLPLVQCGHPQYTDEARVAHLAGLVTVSLTVDDEGMPTDLHIVSPLGLGLDESAMACVSQSRYSPAQSDGKPVPFKLNVPLEFEERWDSDWHLGAAIFRTAAGAARPILVKAVFPPASPDRRSLSVCIHLTIDRNGRPSDVQVPAAQDAKLEKQAVDLVAGWRFRPGTKNGQPVDVPAILTLVHGNATHLAAR